MPDRFRQIRVFSYIFLVLLPLLAIWLITKDILYWGFGIERLNSDLLGQNFYEIYPNPPVAERQLYGGLAAIPVLILRLLSLWYLWRMFRNFVRGHIMIETTVYHLKQYAKYSVFSVIAFFFLSGVRRWGIGEFSDMPLWTHLQLNPHETVLIFTSAVIYVAAQVIDQGNRYKAETESYV